MNIYTVHIKQENPLESAIFVKEGFSWMASVLHVFWALYHKLWLVSLVLFSVEVGVAILQNKGVLNDGVAEAIKIGTMLLIGAHFNDLQRISLHKKGYDFYGVVSARNEEEARYKFIEDMLQCKTFGSGNNVSGLI